ncbi:MAG: PAS domain S-box protein [Verrucomicrobia bacterium]|nr:PAS domain S-box protein [Verrucomicrobiota bacterium]
MKNQPDFALRNLRPQIALMLAVGILGTMIPLLGLLVIEQGEARLQERIHDFHMQTVVETQGVILLLQESDIAPGAQAAGITDAEQLSRRLLIREGLQSRIQEILRLQNLFGWPDSAVTVSRLTEQWNAFNAISDTVSVIPKAKVLDPLKLTINQLRLLHQTEHASVTQELAATSRKTSLTALIASLAMAVGGFFLVTAIWRRLGAIIEADARLRRSLLESEERLRLSLQAAGQGLYDLNLATGQAHVTPEYATMIGHDPATFQETNATWAERLHPDDRGKVYSTFEAYIRGDIQNYEVEFRQRTKDGNWLWTLSIGSIVSRDADGKPLRMLGTHTNLTARKRAEQALAEKEAQLSAIVDGAFDGIVMADVITRRFTFANTAMSRILGYTPEELLTMHIADIHPAESHQDHKNHFDAIARGETTTIRNAQVLRKDGTFRTVDIAGSVVLLKDQRYNIGVFRDITDQKHQEEDLRIKEAAIAAAASGIAISSPSGSLTYANQSFLKLWGYSQASEVLGHSVLDFWQDPGEVQLVIGIIQSQGAWLGELVARRRDGSTATFEVAAHRVTDREGTIVAMMASFTDVSERRQTSEALRNSELRLNEAQRIAHLGSWELDLRTGRLYWSAEIFRLFEIDPNEFDATYETFLKAVHPDDRDAVNLAYNNSLRDRLPYRIIHRLQMPDGRIKHVEEQCESEFTPEGTPLQSRGTVQDVTERVMAKNTIRKALQEKETLLKEIHHRVKNNLQIISSLLYFHAKRMADPAGMETFNETRTRLQSMILVHEKLYQSNDLSAVDFADYTQVLVKELESTSVHNRQIRFRVNTEPLTLPIELAQPCGMIFVELITNVIKYAYPSDSKGDAEVTVRSGNNSVELIVQDHGNGMPTDFDPIRANSFGWQLIRRLSAQLNGSFLIERNHGTKVTISFPFPA